MEKPITVTDREYRENLINLTNDAGLPTFMKKAAVKELYDALSALDAKEREQAEREWAEAQKTDPKQIEATELNKSDEKDLKK